ncbi:MAG: hypothetical protein L6408_09615 [Nanoarchaeota archaeon]|nr:hypothetical protein [Nanoarchaeota archaeon]
MFIDLILCKEHSSDLDFDSVMAVEPIEFTTKNDIRKKINKIKDLKIVLGSKSNRTLVEMKNIDILLSPERGVKKDHLHYRNSGLNQVVCKLAKKRNIAIGFNFNDILITKGKERAQILGRMMQNVRLCRKYKLGMVLGSFAKDKWQMRARNDMISLGIVLGMHPEEAKKSLEMVGEILKEKKDKKYFIREGIKLIKS